MILIKPSLIKGATDFRHSNYQRIRKYAESDKVKRLTSHSYEGVHSRFQTLFLKRRSVLTETPKRFGSNAEAFLFFAEAYFIFH